jgi:transposase
VLNRGKLPIFGLCFLIMRLHEEFGISVSDDTVYRALKDLGFSHVSARRRLVDLASLSTAERFLETLPRGRPFSPYRP